VRRIFPVLLLVAVLAVAGYFLLRPKAKVKAKAKSVTGAVSDAAEQGAKSATGIAKSAGRSVGRGKTSGKLKATTKEERRAQAKKIRDEERRRKKELKRQEREKRRMLKYARRRGGRRKAAKGVGSYVLKAVVLLGDQSYCLIDGRKAQVGDIVMGRKIVEIGPGRIQVEAFGRVSTVRVGESLLPQSYNPKRQR